MVGSKPTRLDKNTILFCELWEGKRFNSPSHHSPFLSLINERRFSEREKIPIGIKRVRTEPLEKLVLLTRLSEKGRKEKAEPFENPTYKLEFSEFVPSITNISLNNQGVYP